MAFFTVINCMDGRVQLPVLEFIKERFKVDYVDSITEPGPIQYLFEQTDSLTTESILKRVKISLDRHESRGVAIVGHYDCAGNPLDKDRQLEQLARARDFLKKRFPHMAPVLLWVNENWHVELVC